MIELTFSPFFKCILQVIHYHFPPDAKLFVHRSGRAARAGRIGFCWGLVDPEEMPYMIDLHLILGRRAANGSDDEENSSYTLQQMTPQMVHYGSLPVSILTQEVENVQRLLNSEMAGSMESESLRSLSRVCNNAMKQYRRTRPEASRDAVRRAKAIMEGTRLESGQRVGKGRIPTHPLLRDIERKVYLAGSKSDDDKLHSMNNFKDCENLLEQISAFRPKETVFEAFATGAAKDTGVGSQVDKGRTTSTRKGNSAVALNAMKNMRRQMKAVRNKGEALVVAGSSTANRINDKKDADNDSVTNDNNTDTEAEGNETTASKHEVSSAVEVPVIRRPQQFLSKAERRRQTKAKKSGQPISAPSNFTESNTKATMKLHSSSGFRDPTFYIENDLTGGNTEEANRARRMEAAMQPSAGLKGIVGQAYRIEEAMLDVVGDENEEMVQKQRMMRWDKSKRKYVQTTVGEELRGDSKSKKMRLESGQLVKGDKLKLGELYVKWQKKTNRSIGRTGVFDDGPTVSAGADDDVVRGGGGRYNNKKQKGKAAAAGAADAAGGGTKSAVDIKKNREKKHDMKLKNMKKTDRRRVEQRSKPQQGRGKGGGCEGGRKFRTKKGS